MKFRSRHVAAALGLASLLVAPGAAGKEFGPGDLRVCGAERCVPVMRMNAVRALSAFYFLGEQPAAVAQPRWGAPAFELRFRNGYATGIVATPKLDRFLSYGVHLERFRRGTWYRLTPPAAAELRRLSASLEPLRVTPAAVRRSR